MTHKDKVQALYRHMQVLEVSEWTAAPPLWRLLWRVGYELPPPMFNAFMHNALLLGVVFGIGWGLLMAVAQTVLMPLPLMGSLATWAGAAIMAGVLFGLFMASYFHWLARKHRLGSWDSYTGLATANR
jgi:hypothetical protein